MIFKPELVEKVLSGEKTVTRRPVKHEVWDTGVKGVALPCRYETGKDYAVQPGRGQKAVGRILITDVSEEMLGTIDNKEARLEGFKDRAAFVDYWERLYGTFDSTQHVWRIRFEVPA